jgi:hypothetical protein
MDDTRSNLLHCNESKEKWNLIFNSEKHSHKKIIYGCYNKCLWKEKVYNLEQKNKETT